MCGPIVHLKVISNLSSRVIALALPSPTDKELHDTRAADVENSCRTRRKKFLHASLYNLLGAVKIF